MKNLSTKTKKNQFFKVKIQLISPNQRVNFRSFASKIAWPLEFLQPDGEH